MIFGVKKEVWEEKKSYNTAKEILQQPKLWRETLNIYENNKKNLKDFFEKIQLNEEFDIVFTGAGTSEYVGNILAPLLRRNSSLNFKSIATTDILNNPLDYIKKDKKLLLVSFARSGDSPESLGTVEFVDKYVENSYHLFITCNENGALAKKSKNDNEKYFTLLMPEESNDKGFAMTSSFSCMLLSGILVFEKVKVDEIYEIIDLSEKELNQKYEVIKEIAENNHERIVILGSSFLGGLAQELALKIMELSAGKVVAVSNTTLGFRHGPKSIVNNNTIVFNLINEDSYAKKYDEGLMEEMYNDETRSTIVGYCITENEKINKNSYKVLLPSKILKNSVLSSIFIYLIYGQMYAFFKSQYLGNTTDNPFPSGEVNRVVKKFKVYEYGE